MGKVMIASAPPTAPAKAQAVFRSKFTQGSYCVNKRRLVSTVIGIAKRAEMTWAPREMEWR